MPQREEAQQAKPRPFRTARQAGLVDAFAIEPMAWHAANACRTLPWPACAPGLYPLAAMPLLDIQGGEAAAIEVVLRSRDTGRLRQPVSGNLLALLQSGQPIIAADGHPGRRVVREQSSQYSGRHGQPAVARALANA